MTKMHKTTTYSMFIKRDLLYIVVVVFALAACLYTLYSVGDYQQLINEHWEQQWEQSGCVYKYTVADYNFTMPIIGVIHEGQNQNPNP